MPLFLILSLLCLLGFAPAGYADTGLTAPYIAARAYYLIEVESHQPLAALDPDRRVEPASLTKLMTAYLTFQALRSHKLEPGQSVPVSAQAWQMGGSRMFIEPHKPVTVLELLHGLIIDSGNDAAVALAESVAGSESAFVAKMNETAQSLGMVNTHYANATGLPDAQHYSSAHDLSILSLAVLQDFPEFYPLYGQKEFRYNGITQPNRNRLLWIDPSVDGLKTGHTDSAGYCLISSAHRGERRLVAVVLGTRSDRDRTTESQKLLNWGFEAFESRRVFQKNTPIKTLEVFKGTHREVPAGFANDVWMTTPKNQPSGAHQTLTTLQPVIAPVEIGQKLGSVALTYNGQTLGTQPLVALDSVPIGNTFTRAWDSLRLILR